jgi:hypothetical protein
LQLNRGKVFSFYLMKKILFLSVNYPPMLTAGSARASRFVVKLPELGWAPLVGAPADIAWDEDGKTRAMSESSEFNGIYRTGELVDAAMFGSERSALLLQGLSAHPGTASPFRRITGMLSGVNLVSGWEKRALSVVTEIIQRHDSVDAIYAQGPPEASLVLALELSEKHGVPVLFDLVAPLDRTASQGARPSDLAKIEERVLTSGHTIMVPTRALKEYFLKKYFGKATHDDIWIVQDFCYGQGDVKSGAKHDSVESVSVTILLETVSVKEMKLFMSIFAGFMHHEGSLSGRSGIRFIGGDGEAVAKYARKYMPQTSCLWGPRCNTDEELACIRRSDLFVVVLGQHESSMLVLPDRVVDALCMKKKVVIIGPDGPAAQVAREAGGFSASLHDSSAVVQALNSSFDDRQGMDGKAVLPDRLSASGALRDLSKILAYMLPV